MKRLIDKLFQSLGIEVRRTPPVGTQRSNRPGNAQEDDFNWNTYREHYENELREIGKVHTLKLKTGDYNFENDTLKISSDILPLHSNHRLLYETVLHLNPQTVCELGCGGGDHLYNLNLLRPALKLVGYDRSARQLSLAMERSPSLKGKLEEFDGTLPFSSQFPQVDLAYTQAVIMHIQTGNGHLTALSNLFKFATKHVVLMENWKKHSFWADIQFLFEKQMIPWKQLHFYLRRAPELNNKPHLMVVSAQPLGIEPLVSYSQLADAM